MSNLPEKEQVLYGTRKGNEAWQEELLSTQPEKFELIKKMATKDGFERFRIATIDLRSIPNFAKTINRGK